MTDATKAVFLSYASQDAGAAKRIADALRAAGVEVWFDTDGGLEHGDEWDRKIRRQIKECVLFLPLISANTQAREEGYFRLEWDMAAERARTIASGVAFILPVVIDDTKEPAALVPDRFRTVQWTKLPGGNVPANVLQRFLKLWSHRTGTLKHETERANAPTAVEAIGKPGGKSYALVAVAIALLVAGLAWWMLRPAASGPTPVVSVPPPPAGNETDQLVRQARELIYDPDSARNEFALAGNLLKRATDLAPASGAAWGASALLNHYFYSRTYDGDRQRLVRSQAEAEKALRLDPRNTDALLALGLHRQELGDKDRAQDYLDRALAADPQNFKALLAQSQQLPDHSAKAKFLLKAADRVSRPAELLYYAAIELGWAWRFAESEPVCERAIAAQPFWRTYVQRAVIVECLTADPAAMNRWLDKVPESKRDEPRVAFMRFSAAMLQRDGAAAVRALNSLAADYLEDSFYTGPRAFLLAQAHELAGQPGLAAEQWQLTERVVREKLAADPGGIRLRAMLAVSLAGQHRPAEARTVADACAADDRIKENTPAIELTARAYARLGEPDRAIELLRLIPAAPSHTGGVYAANLEVTPLWDALRDRPGYARLLEELKRAEHREGDAPAATAPKIDDKSVAVLAFANLSDDKANEYFSDGISEELLNVLAKVPKLKVAARTSSFYFKGRNEPIPEIAQKLGVAYVVEGSVRKAGNKVRVTAQLIKAADGFHVWSETYDRDLTDIFAVQDEIAKNILGVVKGSLMGEAELPHLRATKIEAYTIYLQGQGAFAKRGDAGLREAIRLFEAALAIDPDYVPALVGLGQARALVPVYANLSGAKAREMIDGAMTAAKRALALDARNPDAYAVIGWLLVQYEWKWSEGEAAVRRALELAPNDAWIWNSLGDHQRFIGEFAKGIAAKQRAWELDPLSPVSHWDLGYANLVAGNLDQALHWSDLAVSLAPHNLDSYEPGIMAACQAGQPELMRRLVTAARQNVHENEGLLLLLEARTAILEKKFDEARRLLAKVAPLAESGESTPAFLGYCYLLLGDADQAASWLQRAYEQHDPAFVWNEFIDLNVIAANPKTRPILDRPGIKELYELRQRNARARADKL